MDEAAKILPRSGLRLLLHLVAQGIQQRSCQITMSQRYLAEQLGMSRDNVALACSELKHVLKIDTETTTSTIFVLPDDWFEPQLSLFAMPGGRNSRPLQPENQATAGLETRPLVAEKPGHWWPKNQANRPENQANWPGNQATTGLENRPSGLNTRPAITHNQQLTDSPLIDRSNRFLPSVDSSVPHRVSIEQVNRLPAELREHAEKLQRWLRDYFNTHHPSHAAPPGPDEIILAKCLSVAPLANLAAVLKALDQRKTHPGETWAWFVTVFCQRIHRKKPHELQPSAGFYEARKQPASETDQLFEAELLSQVNGAARRMQ
jgi:hypothetical protein